MRVVALGQAPRALIFDLDSTLYSDPSYAAFQEEVLVERLGRELGIGPQGAAAKIAALRAERESAGKGKTSLGNLFAALGFDVRTSVRWREEHIDPQRWLVRDPALDAALAELSRKYRLALVTNNPRAVGEKSLLALGIHERFAVVVGLDCTMVSKPAPEPFLRAATLLDCEPAECVSIGDRYDIDLEPALALGMGAILVSGAEDVYRLPAVLCS